MPGEFDGIPFRGIKVVLEVRPIDHVDGLELPPQIGSELELAALRVLEREAGLTEWIASAKVSRLIT